VDADSEAYARDGRIQLPADSAERDSAIQGWPHPRHGNSVPHCKLCRRSVSVLEELRAIIHINVASDLQVGMQMLRTSLRGAIANMRTNLTDVKIPLSGFAMKT